MGKTPRGLRAKSRKVVDESSGMPEELSQLLTLNERTLENYFNRMEGDETMTTMTEGLIKIQEHKN